MNSGSVAAQSRAFRDCKAIFGRAEMVFLDHQSRGQAGFEENADTGKLVHGVLGWDRLAPESMAMYQSARNSFRLASKPAAEARMWMIEGFAGGIQPWWHHIGAWHEDRRMYRTAEPVMKWYAANEQYLVKRRPLATVGIAWSQRNTDFYGQDRPADFVDAPYRGFTSALMRARIPSVPVHIDHVAREAANLKVLILPNLAAMTDSQCDAVRAFVAAGGAVIATGVTSLYTEFGDPRKDYGLAALFGAHSTGRPGDERGAALETAHTYLRITPDLRRHPILRGFDETDILPFGGSLHKLDLDASVEVPMTFIPPFPIYPPETSWMREPKTDIPALILNKRVAFLPADIDRRYNTDHSPDHADLLANIVRWAADGAIPLAVDGHGLFDCNLYTQPGRVIGHFVNLTATGRIPIDDLIPVGPLKIRIQLPNHVTGRTGKLLVSNTVATTAIERGWVHITIPSIFDHEVLVIE